MVVCSKEVIMNNEIIKYLNYSKLKNFNDLLFSYIDKKGCKDSEIYKKVNIDRKLFSKIRCNSNYIPRKNIVIKLCLALNLNKNDFTELLNSAGYSLSNNKFDLVISYFIDNNIYDLNIINDYLYTFCNTYL